MCPELVGMWSSWVGKVPEPLGTVPACNFLPPPLALSPLLLTCPSASPEAAQCHPGIARELSPGGLFPGLAM